MEKEIHRLIEESAMVRRGARPPHGAPFRGALYIVLHHVMVRYI